MNRTAADDNVLLLLQLAALPLTAPPIPFIGQAVPHDDAINNGAQQAEGAG